MFSKYNRKRPSPMDRALIAALERGEVFPGRTRLIDWTPTGVGYHGGYFTSQVTPRITRLIIPREPLGGGR